MILEASTEVGEMSSSSALPSAPQAGGSRWLRQQRHDVLNFVLGVVLAIGLPAIIYVLLVTFDRRSLSFNGGYYLATYVVVLALFLMRRMPDNVRVLATLAVFFGFSVLSLYSGWLASSGRSYLLSLILVSSLLIDERASRATAILALATFAAFGWGFGTGLISLRPEDQTDVSSILIEGFGFALAVGIVVSSQLFLDRAIKAADGASREAREAGRLLDQRARQLEAANAQLETLGKAKDAFVSNVSHELRTPISSMILHHELLSIHPDRRETYLATMRRETDRLAHIIEGLLTLSRLDQARVEYRPVLADFGAIAAVYVADRTPLAASRGIALRLEIEPALPKVELDEGLMGQALGILLTNALSYTPSGGTVSVRASRRLSDKGKEWVSVTIRDTGPGIPPDEIPHLFERFFRGAAGRASGTPGTGLGLSIAKEIVTRHGGRIELVPEMEAAPGAEFTIWLPVPGASKL
jgi:signal transduction histidine kinase